ncbi:TPA: hypothetical protein ACP31N_001056 [Pseudomonas aeruginosa]
MSKELNKAPAEQAGGDERAAFELFVRKHCGMPEHIAVNWGAKFTNDAWEGWQARAALAQPSPAQADEKPGDSILCYGCFAKGVGPDHFDEAGKCLARQQTEPLGAEFAQVLSDNLPELLSTGQAEQAEAERLREAYEWGYGDGQNNPNGYSDKKERDACVNELLKQPSPAQAEQHWPKLEKPAQVGAVRFSAGVSSRLVVEAAQRLYEFESTPEKEAERPEVVASVVHSNPVILGQCGPLNANDELMTVAQHAASVARWAEMFNRVEQERDAALAEVNRLRESKGDPSGSFDRCMRMMYERDENAKRLDAALAKIAELEAKLSDPTAVHQWQFSNAWFDGSEENVLKAGKEGSPIRTLYTAPVAQAQHSVPEGWMLVECGIWTQEQVDEMQKTVARFRNSEFVDDRALAMAVADAGQCKAPEISLAELLAAAPGNEGV